MIPATKMTRDTMVDGKVMATPTTLAAVASLLQHLLSQGLALLATHRRGRPGRLGLGTVLLAQLLLPAGTLGFGELRVGIVVVGGVAFVGPAHGAEVLGGLVGVGGLALAFEFHRS